MRVLLRFVVLGTFVGTLIASGVEARQTGAPGRPAPGQMPPPSSLPGALPPVMPAAGPPPPSQSTPPPGQKTPPQPVPGMPQSPGLTLPARAEPATSWQNVKLDVTITDSLSADQQTRKMVSMLVLDSRAGQVRSAGGNAVINIDATPTILRDGRIYLRLTLEYQPELTAQQRTGVSSPLAMFNESLSLVVPDGKPIVASQSSDPRSERKVAVEIVATVVK